MYFLALFLLFIFVLIFVLFFLLLRPCLIILFGDKSIFWAMIFHKFLHGFFSLSSFFCVLETLKFMEFVLSCIYFKKKVYIIYILSNRSTTLTCFEFMF